MNILRQASKGVLIVLLTGAVPIAACSHESPCVRQAVRILSFANKYNLSRKLLIRQYGANDIYAVNAETCVSIQSIRDQCGDFDFEIVETAFDEETGKSQLTVTAGEHVCAFSRQRGVTTSWEVTFKRSWFGSWSVLDAKVTTVS